MAAQVKKSGIAEVSKVVFSGVFGVIITLLYQHFFNPPQSLTLIYNGNEVVVTEAEYVDLAEQNDSLNKELEALQEKFSDLQTQLESQQSVREIEQLLKQATDYWNSADYVQALAVLKNSKIQSDDIKTLYSKYSKEYILDLLIQADTMIAERRYEDAVSLLNSGKGLVADAAELNNKINEIRDNSPVKLSKMKITSSRFFELQESKLLIDTVGNSYPTGNLFTAYAEGNSNYGYAAFYLEKRYSELTGIIAVSDESEDIGLEGWIEIYTKTGDDYTRVYKSPILNRMSAPVELRGISLSNADWVEIRYYNGGDYFSLAHGYHSLKIIISAVTLYS